MAPAPVFTIFAFLFLVMFVVVSFGAVAALARSPAGRWVLAFGALGLTALVAVVGMYFVSGVRVERLDSRGAEELIQVRAAAAPDTRSIRLEAESAAGDSVVLPEAAAPAGAPSSPEIAVTPRPKDEPIRKQTAGANRPAWMDQPMGKHDGVFRTIATAGPYSTPQECHEKLNDAIQKAIEHYVDRFLPNRADVKIDLPPSFIHNHLARGEWLEQSEYSFGTMYNLHSLLIFDEQANQEIDRLYHAGQVQGRLAYTGAGAGLVLALIGTLFAYLKLDTLTRGYYTGRLRLAAAAGILALAAVAGLLAQRNIGF